MTKLLGSGTSRTNAAWRPWVPMNTLLPLWVRTPHCMELTTWASLNLLKQLFKFSLATGLLKQLGFFLEVIYPSKWFPLLQISTRPPPTWWRAASTRQSKSGSAAEGATISFPASPALTYPIPKAPPPLLHLSPLSPPGNQPFTSCSSNHSWPWRFTFPPPCPLPLHRSSSNRTPTVLLCKLFWM